MGNSLTVGHNKYTQLLYICDNDDDDYDDYDDRDVVDDDDDDWGTAAAADGEHSGRP